MKMERSTQELDNYNSEWKKKKLVFFMFDGYVRKYVYVNATC